MSTVEDKKTKVVVVPFAIEIDTSNNGDIMLASIPGCRLRGSLSASKTVTDGKTGEELIPRDQAIHLGMLPAIPGMQLHVNPAKCTYRIVDPLCDNEALLERIRKHIRQNGAFSTDERLKGVEEQTRTLDVHRMKNLCREMLWLLDSNEAKLIKGPMPEIEDIDDMPGNYLLNPGSQVHNNQPRYEKDFDKWVENLGRSGG